MVEVKSFERKKKVKIRNDMGGPVPCHIEVGRKRSLGVKGDGPLDNFLGSTAHTAPANVC